MASDLATIVKGLQIELADNSLLKLCLPNTPTLHLELGDVLVLYFALSMLVSRKELLGEALGVLELVTTWIDKSYLRTGPWANEYRQFVRNCVRTGVILQFPLG